MQLLPKCFVQERPFIPTGFVWITRDFPSERMDKGGQQAAHSLDHTKSPVTHSTYRTKKR